MKKISLILGFVIISLVACQKEEAKKATSEVPTGVPDCINERIAALQAAAVMSPPASIWSYIYKGEVVYFSPQECCDIPSVLVNANCVVICSPDGGLSGGGDGKCKDFFALRTAEKLIWQDPR